MPPRAKSVTSTNKRRPKNIKMTEKITWAGTIIGLIVDLIAITQIIAFTLNRSTNSSYLSVFIRPSVGVVIWGLAFFVYLAFLHLYWENHNADKNFSSKFFWFLVNDLVLKFKKPFLLLPVIIWVIVGFPLLSLVGMIFQSCLGTFLMLGVVILFVMKMSNLSLNDFQTDMMGRITETMKSEIENDWNFLENRIKMELDRSIIVRYTDFKDLEEVRSYDMRTFWYILALYASKNPESAKFGALWKVQGDDYKTSLVDVNVLVDLRNFLSNDYYVS